MPPQNVVYKICSRKEWESAVSEGEYPGAPIDLKDGFIHFSNGQQVRETAAKHFAGVSGLVLVSFDATQFGDALRWEVSRGGDEFPHLYGPLSTAKALDVQDLPIDDDGVHVFPEVI